MSPPDSFEPGATSQGTRGQLAHPDAIAHSDHLAKKLHRVHDKAWSLVGNGLSNQSFIEGPQGLIVIDTGECNEEMADALAHVRKETNAPLAACIYTHFHYVSGTQTLLKENPELPIWGHAGIQDNINRFGGEISPRSVRGLVHQFGVVLPDQGPDAVVNVGLGNFFRNPDHAPFTNGYVPALRTFDTAVKTSIAGLAVEFYPAPSDATDSVTIWFPELKLAVNNLLWPALYNVFAIRGEQYRDPQIVLRGLDELAQLEADALIGTHGPPIIGQSTVLESIRDYRDTIQFMWDQTVRCANAGLTLNETIAAIKLPAYFNKHYITRQFYGVVEHHVRQIYTGLFGWFDEDEAHLFPTPAPQRSVKLIKGFGGITNVRNEIDEALAVQDYRWAIELSSWIVRSGTNEYGRADAGEPEDRRRLASALRGVAQSTTSANIRNWCLTRALELEGTVNLDRFRGHRFRTNELLRRPAVDSLPLLRVLLVPELAADLEDELRVSFADGSQAGLAVRHGVAVPTNGKNASLTMALSAEHWAEILGGKLNLSHALEAGSVVTSDVNRLSRFFECFDLHTLSH